MSAKDRLDTYERDWGRHERWRMPHDDSKPGLYIDRGRDTCVKLHEMSSDLRTRVTNRLESAVRQLVNEEYEAMLAAHRLDALEEAKRTLAELGGATDDAGPGRLKPEVFLGGDAT